MYQGSNAIGGRVHELLSLLGGWGEHLLGGFDAGGTLALHYSSVLRPLFNTVAPSAEPLATVPLRPSRVSGAGSSFHIVALVSRSNQGWVGMKGWLP
jgi:hypothetical protein